ncbi:hypothetical protein SBA7_610019 [Candidatus Sulfotelmatobacter sp. SbA7]|nr:hypothetical protein SBA7_610019 [Candidatus Sulfotelmatobacter sp. SbA7]
MPEKRPWAGRGVPDLGLLAFGPSVPSWQTPASNHSDGKKRIVSESDHKLTSQPVRS